MNIKEYQNYHETKSHTSSEFPYNTYLCSIPLDFTQVPFHWHEELELIVIKKGQGYVSADLHSETVTAGDIVLILPGSSTRSIRRQAVKWNTRIYCSCPGCSYRVKMTCVRTGLSCPF